MGEPQYRLEGIVRTRSEHMEDFEGPLDVIFLLLSKNKIEIQDVSITAILEQYLAYLEQRQQMDLEVASEFVTMAAHLMYIKTRMLLSIEDEEAQSEMDALIKSLEERQRGENYAKIKQLTERLAHMRRMERYKAHSLLHSLGKGTGDHRSALRQGDALSPCSIALLKQGGTQADGQRKGQYDGKGAEKLLILVIHVVIPPYYGIIITQTFVHTVNRR